MLGNQRRLLLIMFLFLLLLFMSGCFINMKRVIEIASDNREQLPIRSLRITIDPSQREDFFEQLQKFADKHAFDFKLSDYGTGGANFLVEILSEDIEILAVDIPKAPEMISVRFYDRRRSTPVSEETMDVINELAIDLENYIMEIPEITILEQ